VGLLNEAINLFDASRLNQRFDQARSYELLGDVYRGMGQTADAAGAYRLAHVGYHHAGCEVASSRISDRIAQSSKSLVAVETDGNTAMP
jgi:hypothetical protein